MVIVRIDIRRDDDALRRRLEALNKSNGHARRNLLAILDVLTTDDDAISIDVEP